MECCLRILSSSLNIQSLCSRLLKCSAQPIQSESLQSITDVSLCDQSTPQPSGTAVVEEANVSERVSPLEANVSERVSPLEANVSERVSPLEANVSERVSPLEANASDKAQILEVNMSDNAQPLEANASEATPSEPKPSGNDANPSSQNVDPNSSAAQNPIPISSVPGESERDGICDQTNSNIQGSEQMTNTKRDHTTGSRKRHADDSDDSDYVNHRGTLHIVNGVRYYGYKTKAVKKAIARRVDAMNGLNVNTLSGRDKGLLNLRNVGDQMRRELRKAAKKRKTSDS